MGRLLATILGLLAVLGLPLPPAVCVHAHEDGHAPHAHGPGDGGHAPIHVHGPARDVPEGVQGSEDPEHHVHGGDPEDAAARPRTQVLADDAAAPGPWPAPAPGPFAGSPPPVLRAARADDPQGRAPPRVLTRLVTLGCLRS